MIKYDKFPTVSIIIMYTNDKQIEECQKWIKRQKYSGKIEIIILDNRGNKNYSSCAEALNDGARKAKGSILFFIHQDIYLWDLESINKCVDFIISHPDSIIGAAGIGLEDKQTHFDLDIKGTNKQYAWHVGEQPLLAYTLDECMLVMNIDRYQLLKFDEITCDNWHFYGAEICLNNILNGGHNYIMPLQICHDSFGSPDSKAFKLGAKKMIKKYHGKFATLTTTCINCKCSNFGLKWYYFIFYIKAIIKFIAKCLGLKKLLRKINIWRRKRKGLYTYEG